MAERVVLITGGARGIGREIGLTLAARHWSVAVCYRTSVQAAEETAAAMAERGAPRTKAVQCDVSEPEAAEGFIRTAEADWGRIDALINCAGPYHRVDLLDETPEGWLSMFANNLHPVFYCARAVAPGMKERRWGRIVSFSMATADRISAQPQITAHFIAKSGILVLTRSLARLLAPYGITVNAISPGFIASGSAPPEELQSMVKNIPAGHLGSTQDAAGVTSFLLSEEARYVTGANIHVSGGWGL
jgi:3-oxoacyl-[acyl-carrier protein] reductase